MNDDETLDIILKFFYSNQNISSIQELLKSENIFNVLSFAHCLEIESLNKFLAEIIKNNFLNENNCTKVFYESLIVKYNLFSFKIKFWKMIVF